MALMIPCPTHQVSEKQADKRQTGREGQRSSQGDLEEDRKSRYALCLHLSQMKWIPSMHTFRATSLPTSHNQGRCLHMLQEFHHCPCPQKDQNPLSERLPPSSTHLQHHAVLWAVSQNIHHLLPSWLTGPTSDYIQAKQVSGQCHCPSPSHCPLPPGPEEHICDNAVHWPSPPCSSSELVCRPRASPTSWSSMGTTADWPERPRHALSMRASSRPSWTATAWCLFSPCCGQEKRYWIHQASTERPRKSSYPQATRIVNEDTAWELP